MEIKRDNYLQKLLDCRHNGMIKIITGMRRCGKSYLLFEIFYNYLISIGISPSHIIKVDFEDRRNISLRDPDALLQFIDSKLIDNNMYYILLDEIQHVREFEDVLNSYLKIKNADIYVTGSNSKFLSKDVITEFRGRGYEIKLSPLSFAEFASVHDGEPINNLLLEYMTYGGLPQVVMLNKNQERENFLKSLFTNTYLRDIKDRYNIQLDNDLEDLITMLASSIGGLTNPRKLENAFRSVKHSSISQDTIKKYIDYLKDAFLIEKAVRYDIKGKRYLDTPAKYYFEDLGLRNARLNFRQFEEPHLMENLIYNELRIRGMSVDVGEVVVNAISPEGKNIRKYLEVDFVCNMGYKRYYIQSAYNIPDDAKREQELKSLRNIKDSFQKVVIVGNHISKYQNNDGILFISLYDFLKDENSLRI